MTPRGLSPLGRIPGALELVYQEPLALDYLLVLLVFVIPWQLLLDGKLLDFRKVAKQLPWGALIVVFSSHIMGIIAKECGLAVWISNRIGSGHLNSVPLSQVILAVCSALMTELMTDVATASILLPVALDVAISIQCHPLLLVLPMSVAASTSLIFPTGSLALALLHSVTGLAPLEMMMAGLSTKVASITAILIGVNTVGYYLFDWRSPPPWLPSHNESSTRAPLPL
ncbi:solute carrier family 13 member 2-like [Ixodes scapularis]|uniref:solute carrier family 13 member 2-like n=1 Tax=Ixodes scapularis TaxID=6945 RepID=UPI001C38F967|nr:solute carrier family 13 member 2-like [Ixodes scapularis]